MNKYKLFLIAVFALIAFAPSRSAGAATLSVPNQYGSIQSAINAAQNGDSVVVSPGTYREQLTIVGKYIDLRSASNNYNDTIIAPAAGRTGIMIQQVPFRPGAPQAHITGFKITGANYAPDGQGGAFTIANNADPILENNLIDANHSNIDGGGVLIFNNSNPTIRNNRITNNGASRFGGAIFSVKNCQPVIYGNTITGNTVSGAVISGGGSSGGAIYMENDVSNTASHSVPVISNNTISGNTADFAGGAISLRTGISVIIERNTITSNHASYGGGIHIETEGADPIIANNIISNNTASYSPSFPGSGYGGGISVYSKSTPRILRNTVSNNAASRGGGGIVMAESSNSYVYGNTINNNYVADAGTFEGGGIYIANAQATITNNLLHDNSANLGGGAALLNSATTTLINNTFAKNNATYTGAPNGAAGGGIFVRNSGGSVAGNTVITNNIFSLNQNYQIFEEHKKATFTNNQISNDGKGIYYNYDTGTITNISSFNGNANTNASSNISGIVQFSNSTNNDYSLQSGSSAINSGTAISAPGDDLRRAVRPTGSGIDIGAYEYTTETTFKLPVYRFYSNAYSGHFYTISEEEKNTVLSSYPVGTWHYEFEAYDAFTTQVANTTPVYRFYSQTKRGHFYTIDQNERDSIIASYPDTVYHYEGAVFYVYPSSYTGSAQNVYRFYSPSYDHHFYTDSDAERDYLINNYPSSTWTYEGLRFKVPQ